VLNAMDANHQAVDRYVCGGERCNATYSMSVPTY